MHFNLAKRAAEHRSFRFVSRIAFQAKITEYPRPSQYPLSQLILDTTLIYAQDDRGSKQSLQQQGSKSLSEGNEMDL